MPISFSEDTEEINFLHFLTIEEIIYLIEGNCKYIPALYVFNIIDKVSVEKQDLYHRLERYVPISGGMQWNIDGLLKTISDYLNLVPIYTEPKCVAVIEFQEPIFLNIDDRQQTVSAFLRCIHKTLENELKFALVWDRSTKFSP